jgi:CRP-like cAMP-binding protein
MQTRSAQIEAIRVPCPACPLAGCPGLLPHAPAEAESLLRYKLGELRLQRGGAVLRQGERSPYLFTVLEGVLIRYRLLEDGRRQIVNFMFPGDLIGLQGATGEPLSHSVDALTPAVLCAFPLDGFPELVRSHPMLGVDAIWIAAKEEEALEEHLVAMGQRSARERITYLAVYLVARALETGISVRPAVALSVTQAQIADMLGLSLVHTNRTLQSLRQADLVRWSLTEIAIPDFDAASSYAQFELVSRPRPYI